MIHLIGEKKLTNMIFVIPNEKFQRKSYAGGFLKLILMAIHILKTTMIVRFQKA